MPNDHHTCPAHFFATIVWRLLLPAVAAFLSFSVKKGNRSNFFTNEGLLLMVANPSPRHVDVRITDHPDHHPTGEKKFSRPFHFPVTCATSFVYRAKVASSVGGGHWTMVASDDLGMTKYSAEAHPIPPL